MYNLMTDFSFGGSWQKGLGHNFFVQTHFMPIVFLVVPFYLVFPSAVTLLVVTQVAWMAGAYVVGKIAEIQFESRRLGVLFMGLFILHRSVVLAGMNAGFRPAILSVPFVALSIYFFTTERLRLFLLSIFLASACKENISLIFPMYSLWALYERRDAKWILSPAVLSLSYFFVVNEFVMGADGFSGTNFGYFSYLGDGPVDIALYLLTNPLALVGILLSFDHVAFFVKFLSPTAFLSLLSPGMLFLPASQWLVIILPEPVHFAAIDHHYQAPILPFVFTATMVGIQRGARLLRQYADEVALIPAVLAQVSSVIRTDNPERVLLLVLLCSSVLLHSPVVDYTQDSVTDIPNSDVEAIQEFRAIPNDASVLSQRKYAPYLSTRTVLYNYEYRDGLYPPGATDDADFVIVNRTVAQRYDSNSQYERYRDFQSTDAVIFKRVGYELDTD